MLNHVGSQMLLRTQMQAVDRLQAKHNRVKHKVLTLLDLSDDAGSSG